MWPWHVFVGFIHILFKLCQASFWQCSENDRYWSIVNICCTDHGALVVRLNQSWTLPIDWQFVSNVAKVCFCHCIFHARAPCKDEFGFVHFGIWLNFEDERIKCSVQYGWMWTHNSDLKTKHGTNVEMFLVFLVSGFTKCLKLLLKVKQCLITSFIYWIQIKYLWECKLT